eukprot:3683634-Rhodomonas_salina.1
MLTTLPTTLPPCFDSQRAEVHNCTPPAARVNGRARGLTDHVLFDESGLTAHVKEHRERDR